MHRQPILNLLSAYTPSHDEDRAAASQILTFVKSTPQCFDRSNTSGHITGSAWIVSPNGSEVLLCLHRKLGRWLQPGGHSDGDPFTLRVATREALEETGISVTPHSETIFDCDVHGIPALGTEPAHLHYDIRFALMAPSREFTLSDESVKLSWFPIHSLSTVTTERSVLRMAEKWISNKQFTIPLSP